MKVNTKKVSFVEPLTLQSGEVLQGFDLMTETYGELNHAKDNAVLVCHAFSGNHHAAGKKDGEKKPGWWDELIGDGKTIDTKIILLLLLIILVAVMVHLVQQPLKISYTGRMAQIFQRYQ